MKTDAERVLERVKRLLALSRSDNVHEAALAAAKAQELMSKHQLDAAELEVSEGSEPEPVLEGELETTGPRREPWREILACALAKANGCEVFGTRTLSRRAGRRPVVLRRELRIVGTSASAALVRYMHSYLVREVCRLCRNTDAGVPVKTAAWRNSFRRGAASELARRIQEAAQTARVDASSTAIVRVDNAAARVAGYLEGLGLSDQPATRPSSHTAAYFAGRAAAQSVNLGNDAPALGAGSRANLGSGA